MHKPDNLDKLQPGVLAATQRMLLQSEDATTILHADSAGTHCEAAPINSNESFWKNILHPLFGHLEQACTGQLNSTISAASQHRY